MAFTCIKCHTEIDRSFKACPHCGEPITDFLREYADKPIDGKYRIIQRLGIGGMGEVFKVEHTFLGSIRVVKIIRAQISGSTDAHDRFLREARLATKVQHPNVATLHDFSALPDGSHYMVWEFIEGENLAQLIRRRGTLPPRHAVRIAIQALAGLDAIHRAGIVHRDISPENLMITHAPDGSEFVKIIDLGVAKATESDVAMTQTGMFVGKFRYASPDHLGFLPDRERIDGRADLYSLAVVLFEMLTGRPPFEATSPHEYIIHHSRDEYLNSPDLDTITGSPALQAILARALDRDRNKRYPTAHDFSDALIEIEPTLMGESAPAIAGPFDADATIRTERTSSGRTAAPVSPATVPPIKTVPAQSPAAPRQTVATSSGALGATVATSAQSSGAPAAPSIPAPPTLIGTMPGAAPRKSNTGLIVAIVVLALLLFGALAGFALWRFWPHTSSTTLTTTTTTTTASTASTAKPSQTSLDVTPPTPVLIDNTTAATSTTSTTATATSSPVLLSSTSGTVATPPTTTRAPRPKPVQEEEPAPEEETAAPEPEPAPSSAVTYREKGDGDANDAALAALHRQISGVTRVYLSGGDAEMIKQLSDSLRGHGITLGEGAPVEIRFTGSVNPHGFGRKSRSGNATIKKNGRPIFQYVMPREDYRVGDSPAEAFARILGDALAR
ncbi:MAG: eukaryotic-like serine/threonine-protein kinase [Thermoanaerobaculia bacterium]|jgi:serine/threonine-protein kinase|nr:eukaryotic-like serine/threonine-protein kinase [Thermoanaerobaculia bacterium]